MQCNIPTVLHHIDAGRHSFYKSECSKADNCQACSGDTAAIRKNQIKVFVTS